MDNKKEKVALNDELLDKVAGGVDVMEITNWQGTTCTVCGFAPISANFVSRMGREVWEVTCEKGHLYYVDMFGF